ncbi:PREDICTED: probable ADP-ribosylation factor GTPase-activating protein AGD8 [Camelina sativa]|uniref:Probable ADP-ribosylation factor GTPase-activating protein AGD8 n=1 Tax=Camelina sativa TaxID=90675 RepID=A0ABM0TD00_CAMSA|nr:PREDICTED: probable ADP-ribosylation factor GTPase-activating protein AGD8 [Camelina sativa]
MLGGNYHATQEFFKQYGWTNSGDIEAKYTSEAAHSYSQILAKEVTEAMAEETSTALPPKATGATSSPKKASYTVVHSTFRKRICVKGTRKIGSFGAPTTTKVLRMEIIARPNTVVATAVNVSALAVQTADEFTAGFEDGAEILAGQNDVVAAAVNVNAPDLQNADGFAADLENTSFQERPVNRRRSM